MRLNRKCWGRVAPGVFLGAVLLAGLAGTVSLGWGVTQVVKHSIAVIRAPHHLSG
ncbi:hypothetical protein EV668_3583 [Enterovirga rhinocerotis]|uniref:Uncharacterized protein n=1 Tax=Enterovirga rhinocerotis TaxID=1339210 RepID=A0A4R7BTM0_9HYPH|nr:hypothetical protein EV668_3583 [Enterovirga rhinocerotis]